jgi:hypothetical protein
MDTEDLLRSWKDPDVPAETNPAGNPELTTLFGGVVLNTEGWNTFGCCDTDRGCRTYG